MLLAGFCSGSFHSRSGVLQRDLQGCTKLSPCFSEACAIKLDLALLRGGLTANPS